MANRVALVTGASSGIGECVCRRLLDGGFEVVALQRSRPAIEHRDLHVVEVDLADRRATEAAASDVAKRFNVTYLVNNAGANRPNAIADAPMEDFDYVVDLNLRAAVVLIRHMLPRMRSAKSGRIVNIGSRAALGKPRFAMYATTKAGLVGLTRSLALELGSDWITVNAISPGVVATPLFHDANPPDSPQTKRLLERIAIPRIGVPDDVAHAVMFFFSPASDFITGQVLHVCGGGSLGAAPL
jgi:NAD(P)-dependent dehydrogenase (short-subunit alcohol dehydrogenase family)